MYIRSGHKIEVTHDARLCQAPAKAVELFSRLGNRVPVDCPIGRKSHRICTRWSWAACRSRGY